MSVTSFLRDAGALGSLYLVLYAWLSLGHAFGL